MIANHIHDALGQVRRLQELILDKRRFTGYSGAARMLGGCSALVGCTVMSFFRDSERAQIIGWGLILAFALFFNYGALTLWFFQQPRRKRTFATISPATDAIPPLAVGAVVSVALLMHGYTDLLFGCWMCLLGLAHTVYRSSLPRSNWYLGLYYMVIGAGFLLWPGSLFHQPLAAGAVFFIGEWIGGTIFHRHKIEALEDAGND